MSRYPFMEFADEYMSLMKDGGYSQASWPVIYRRYKRMARDVTVLRNAGRISTASPKHFTPEDVRVILVHHRSEGRDHPVSQSEMVKEVCYLKALCEFCGNTSVSTCLKLYPGVRPSSKHQRLPSFTDREYDAIIEASRHVDPKDFRRNRAYAIVFVCLGCSHRPKEVRLSDVGDYDLEEWIATVVHVKGEFTYGNMRIEPIPPEVRPILMNWIGLRQEYCSRRGLRTNAMFPSPRDGYLSSQQVRMDKRLVEEDVGFTFELRKCRRTFGQRYLDAGLDIESTSVLMGHASTKTTEEFYARRKNTAAMNAAKALWTSCDSDAGVAIDNSQTDENEGAEGEIRTPEDYSSGFRDRRHTGLGYLGSGFPNFSRYKNIIRAYAQLLLASAITGRYNV